MAGAPSRAILAHAPSKRSGVGALRLQPRHQIPFAGCAPRSNLLLVVPLLRRALVLEATRGVSGHAGHRGGGQQARGRQARLVAGFRHARDGALRRRRLRAGVLRRLPALGHARAGAGARAACRGIVARRVTLPHHDRIAQAGIVRRDLLVHVDVARGALIVRERELKHVVALARRKPGSRNDELVVLEDEVDLLRATPVGRDGEADLVRGRTPG